MRWIYLGLFLCYYESICWAFAGNKRVSKVDPLVFATGNARSGHEKRLDDGVKDDWPDERPDTAEIERLVRDYKENLRLLSNIPVRFYELIYPVQLRHHEKVGISTREVGANKTGKHFHHTSLFIKAFDHKFVLDLELNTNLLAPNLIQKHFVPTGNAQLITAQEVEHCYYHGTIKDYPGAVAALRTCNGVSGVIRWKNQTFVIYPFRGGDMSKKHPHVIFEDRAKSKHACGNTRMHEWGFVHIRKHHDDKHRYKRDVREVTKYVELALVVDKAMFERRNTTNKAEIVQDAVQIANIVDMYFKDINTRVSIVYLETWAGGDQIVVGSDVRTTLLNFMEYSSRKLYKVVKDSTQLLTGQEFRGGEAGMSVPGSICTAKSVGVSRDINIYEPHIVAVTVAHAIGHNMGIGHDEGTDCKCADWHGCVMEGSFAGQDSIMPYRFSTCSLKSYVSNLRVGHGLCLFNRPSEPEEFRTCGNGHVEDGEDCDCGNIQDCSLKDPCCDPITCKLTIEAECSAGPCCDKCKLRPPGFLCRAAATECDIPEFCDGRMGQCPTDIYKKNGNTCNAGRGYCYVGSCPTLDAQCSYIWGYDGRVADAQCFEQFNHQGGFNGNCGVDSNGVYRKCDVSNIMCGSLQCKAGSAVPIVPGLSQKFTRTIVSITSKEFECKVTSGTIGFDIVDLGLVKDGTKCLEEKICVNQSCVSVRAFKEPGRCLTNNFALECSGHGVCSNVNTCYCDDGWSSGDCSLKSNKSSMTQILPSTAFPSTLTPSPTTQDSMSAKISNWRHNTTKNTLYHSERNSMSAASLVVVLVSVVGGVFILFALMAVCYRRRSTMPRCDPPYLKKGIGRKSSSKAGKEEETSADSANRIITFGSMPSYREDKMQERQRHRFKREKGDDEECGEADDETVSFIELPPNNLSKIPEKGILKHGMQAERPEKHKWANELSNSDNEKNHELLSPSDNAADCGSSADALTEVERTLKSMNGYHEDILEALRNAASHRGSSQTNLTEELRKSLSDGMPDFAAGVLLKSASEHLGDSSEHVDDVVPPCGPIRIRNLEDLIRQLERHPSRHMSPSGSEDIRMSETEADRYYHHSDAQRDRDPDVGGGGASGGAAASGGGGGTRFVYGRFRQPGASLDRQHSKGALREEMSREEAYHHLPHRGAAAVGGSSAGASGGGVDDDDGDVENGEYVCKHLVRSASEEAMPVMVKREHSFERNLNSGHHEKALKGQTCDYFPSPPSEDSYPDSYEENATFPVPSVSSDSRSGSNDHVFIERQHLSAGLRRGDHRAAAAAAAAASVSSVDSKGKARQLPKSQSPFVHRGNGHHFS